jgi:hypothetical protein
LTFPVAQAITLSDNPPISADSATDIESNTAGLQESSEISAYWLAPAVGSIDTLGELTLPASSHVNVQLLTPFIKGKGGPLVCAGTSWNNTNTGLTIKYKLGSALVLVTVQIKATNTGIQIQLDADQPLIQSVDMGSWAASLRTRAIGVPYYSRNIWYSQGLSAFVNGWWNWHTTHATKLAGTAAIYLPKCPRT